MQRLNEEDPSVSYEQNPDTREMVLWGQGEIHLMISLEKLKGRYNVGAVSAQPKLPYKETIQKTVSQHGRFKRQTGGHGMFGDVHVDIGPRRRGEGFEFTNKIVSQDCWNDMYTEAMPSDGSAWLGGDCSGRVMRGGSWEDYSGELRSGARVGSGIGESYWSDSFRVARDLD